MKEWIPIPGTSKDILLTVALEEFCQLGYKAANITKIAEKAKVTTGAIYHHFGSKAKLYQMIRREMEQRVLDRMEGASSLFETPEEKCKAALITGLDFAVKQNLCKLFSEEVEDSTLLLEYFFKEITQGAQRGLDILVLSAWRSTLQGISANKLTAEDGKALWNWLFRSREEK